VGCFCLDSGLTEAGSPYLLPDAEPEPYAVGEHLVVASSKLIVIDKLLADVLPKGECVLIFSVSNLLISYSVRLTYCDLQQWTGSVVFISFYISA
jgi:hypothetical protein